MGMVMAVDGDGDDDGDGDGEGDGDGDRDGREDRMLVMAMTFANMMVMGIEKVVLPLFLRKCPNKFSIVLGFVRHEFHIVQTIFQQMSIVRL